MLCFYFLKFLINFGHGAPCFHFAEGPSITEVNPANTIRFPDIPGPRAGRKLRSHCLVPSLWLTERERESHHWGDWPEVTPEVRGRDIAETITAGWVLILLYRDPKATSQAQEQVFLRVGHDSCGVSFRHLFSSLAWAIETGQWQQPSFCPTNQYSYIAYIKHFLKAWRKQQIMESSGLRQEFQPQHQNKILFQSKKKRCPKDMMISTN